MILLAIHIGEHKRGSTTGKVVWNDEVNMLRGLFVQASGARQAWVITLCAAHRANRLGSSLFTMPTGRRPSRLNMPTLHKISR